MVIKSYFFPRKYFLRDHMTQIDSRQAGKEQVYQIAPVTQVNILYLFYYSVSKEIKKCFRKLLPMQRLLTVLKAKSLLVTLGSLQKARSKYRLFFYNSEPTIKKVYL